MIRALMQNGDQGGQQARHHLLWDLAHKVTVTFRSDRHPATSHRASNTKSYTGAMRPAARACSSFRLSSSMSASILATCPSALSRPRAVAAPARTRGDSSCRAASRESHHLLWGLARQPQRQGSLPAHPLTLILQGGQQESHHLL